MSNSILQKKKQFQEILTNLQGFTFVSSTTHMDAKFK